MNSSTGYCFATLDGPGYLLGLLTTRYPDMYKKESVTQALDQTKALAVAMKNQLLLGHVDEFGVANA